MIHEKLNILQHSDFKAHLVLVEIGIIHIQAGSFNEVNTRNLWSVQPVFFLVHRSALFLYTIFFLKLSLALCILSSIVFVWAYVNCCSESCIGKLKETGHHMQNVTFICICHCILV